MLSLQTQGYKGEERFTSFKACMKKELTAKQVSLCLNRTKCCRWLDIALENLELMILNYSASTAQHSAKALFLASDYSVKLMSSIQRYKIPA